MHRTEATSREEGLTSSELADLRAAERITFAVSVDSRGRATAIITGERTSEPPRVIRHALVAVTDHEIGLARKLTARGQVAGTAEHWRTIAGLLREGDRLELVLAVDSGNQYLHAARLHADKLCLRVHQPDAGTLLFPLLQTIAPDNFARLVQR